MPKACSHPIPTLRAEARDRTATLAADTGVTLTSGIIATDPGGYEMLELIDAVADAGGRMIGQPHCRGINVLLSFATRLPFDLLPEWQSVRALPHAEQLVALRDPSVRERLIAAAHARRLQPVAGDRRDAPQARLRRHPSVPARAAAQSHRRRGRRPSAACRRWRP